MTAVVLLAMCVSLHKALDADVRDVEGLAAVADKSRFATTDQSSKGETIETW